MMTPTVEIVVYEDSMRDEWMRAHAIIMAASHSWNYTIQERPNYDGYASTRLVALVDGRIAGLTDVQYENHAGELCFIKDEPGGYVLEFGRLPEYTGLNLGVLLIAATAADAREKGFNRLEYWSQDRRAQRFYRRIGLPEIGRHYRFRIEAPQEVKEFMLVANVGVEYLYCACLPEEWPLVKQRYKVIERAPLEPHLCVGFAIAVPEDGVWSL